MTPAQPSIETIVRSNEKLLKAMLALLSLKDEHFLAELKTIFQIAAREGSELAAGDAKVWAEVRRELGLVEALVSGDDEGETPTVKKDASEGVH
jgi:hypothetical protein